MNPAEKKATLIAGIAASVKVAEAALKNVLLAVMGGAVLQKQCE
jgi:hypothetical protein